MAALTNFKAGAMLLSLRDKLKILLHIYQIKSEDTAEFSLTSNKHSPASHTTARLRLSKSGLINSSIK